MQSPFPEGVTRLSVWNLACRLAGQNPIEAFPTTHTLDVLQRLCAFFLKNGGVEWASVSPDRPPIFRLNGSDAITIVTQIADRPDAVSDWQEAHRKLTLIDVRREDWERYQEAAQKEQAHTMELIQEQSTLWARRQPARLFDGPGFSEEALKLTTLSKYLDFDTWTAETAAMLVSGLQAPIPCDAIPTDGAMGLDNGFVMGNHDPFHQARRVLELWRSQENPPARVRPLDFIAWCKTKNIDTAWLRSIEAVESLEQARSRPMLNTEHGTVQLPDVKLIHPESLAQLIAFARSPIPDDKLLATIKKETPDGPHQWKVEPLTGEDWQLVNKLCGGRPNAPCSPQQFDAWRAPFDTSSEKPKWDFHPEFQPSDAMQRAQSQWHVIYSEHLRQLRAMIAEEKLDLLTMDGLRTTDVYDHAGLAYGHMRIDDAKTYLGMCSIPYALSIGDLARIEDKTSATILETTLPPPDHLLTLDGLANAICPGEGREFDRLHWKQAIRQACSGDSPALIARYADGREVEAGTLGTQLGSGTHILSRDAGIWLESKGWTVKHEQRLQVERPAAVPPKLIPDWGIWRHALKAALRDAVCLSCNAEPKAVAIGSVEYGLGRFLNQVVSLPIASKEVCDEISRRLQIAQSHTGPGGTLQTVTGERDGEVNLTVFARWAIDTMKWTVPDELQALMRTVQPAVENERLYALTEVAGHIAKRVHYDDRIAEFSLKTSLTVDMRKAVECGKLPENERRRDGEIMLNEYAIDEWLARERRPYRLGLCTQSNLEQRNMMRAGRLLIETVVARLAKRTNIDATRWEDTLIEAVQRGKLPLKNPRNLVDSLPYAVPKNLRAFYDRVQVVDVNALLDANPSWGVSYRFRVWPLMSMKKPAGVQVNASAPEQKAEKGAYGPTYAVADDSTLTKRERQIRAIEAGVDELGYTRTKVSPGGKKKIREWCKSHHSQLFGSGDSPFDDAWKQASKAQRVMIANRAKYAGK